MDIHPADRAVRRRARTIAAIAWLVPPAAMAAVALFAPNQITQMGSAGTILSASAYPSGGFFSEQLTNIQTTTGTIFVSGIVSVPRGQTLTVQNTTFKGLQACIVGDPPVCMEMGGAYAGKLTPVAHGWSPSQSIREALGAIAFVWLLLGAIGFMATIDMTAPSIAGEVDA